MREFEYKLTIVLDDIGECTKCRWNDGNRCELFNVKRKWPERCSECEQAEKAASIAKTMWNDDLEHQKHLAKTYFDTANNIFNVVEEQDELMRIFWKMYQNTADTLDLTWKTLAGWIAEKVALEKEKVEWKRRERALKREIKELKNK